MVVLAASEHQHEYRVRPFYGYRLLFPAQLITWLWLRCVDNNGKDCASRYLSRSRIHQAKRLSNGEPAH